MYQNTIDGEQILAALAFESRRPTVSVTETIERKLQMLMGLIGVRSAFISALTAVEMQIVVVEDNDGCGLPIGNMPIEESFCQYVKAIDGPVVIPDAANDVRVADVAARRDFNIGAYLGVPIHLMDNQLYGTLCMLDPEAHSFAPTHVALAQIVAGEIAALLDRHLATQGFAQVMSEADPDQSAMFAALDGQRKILQIVAHDLRTPLMSINFSAEALLLGYFGPLQAEQHEVAELVLSAGAVMQRLVTDLSDAVDADSPTLSLITEPLDAQAVSRELIALCRPAAQKASLELQLDIDQASLPMVGDKARLMQILLNLMGNAITYTQVGSVTLRVRAEKDSVCFEVVDTGPGIAPEDQERIWRPYERATQQQQPGFGLGLHIVARLVQAMGGRVELVSKPGVGSSFLVSLPRQATRPQWVRLTD